MTKKSDSLDEALKRSKLSSTNNMEMLTFRLTDGQLYGINVFKIIEIIECPKKINSVPNAHPAVKGVVDFRGKGITVLDISEGLGIQKANYSEELSYLVVCEYNKQLNAFIVSEPETLITRSWDDIHKPKGLNMPAVVAMAYNDENEMILLLDIETLLAEIVGLEAGINDELLESAQQIRDDYRVILLDDSASAMKLMSDTMEKLGIQYTSFDSASNALKHLEETECACDLIISDIEMPGMDGFTFTLNVKKLEVCNDVPVILHSSMSNPTNKIKAVEAGASDFIAKFDPNELAQAILKYQ